MASRRSCPVPVRSEELHRIIQEELSRGIFKPKSKQEMCPSSNRGIAETRGARNRSGMHRISVNNQAIGCLRTCVRHHTSALTDGGGFYSRQAGLGQCSIGPPEVGPGAATL